MRVDLKAEYAEGVTYRLLRSAFVALKGRDWSEATLQKHLGVDDAALVRLVSQLKRDGYVEPPEQSLPQFWRLTVKGNALSQASGAHPVPRSKAEIELTSFLNRVREINEGSDYWYSVTAVYLFGSMLGDSPTVNDIDLMPELVRRQRYRQLDTQAFADACHERLESVLGRPARDFYEGLDFPYREVLLKLRNRSRVISISPMNADWLSTVPHKLIYP